jgi:hypothetical protein
MLIELLPNVNRLTIGQNGQRQVFWTICLSLVFFIYGVSQNNLDENSYNVVTAHHEVPARGLASE